MKKGKKHFHPSRELTESSIITNNNSSDSLEEKLSPQGTLSPMKAKVSGLIPGCYQPWSQSKKTTVLSGEKLEKELPINAVEEVDKEGEASFQMERVSEKLVVFHRSFAETLQKSIGKKSLTKPSSLDNLLKEITKIYTEKEGKPISKEDLIQLLRTEGKELFQDFINHPEIRKLAEEFLEVVLNLSNITQTEQAKIFKNFEEKCEIEGVNITEHQGVKTPVC
jgi:hypothetical protein